RAAGHPRLGARLAAVERHPVHVVRRRAGGRVGAAATGRREDDGERDLTHAVAGPGYRSTGAAGLQLPSGSQSYTGRSMSASEPCSAVTSPATTMAYAWPAWRFAEALAASRVTARTRSGHCVSQLAGRPSSTRSA